MGRRKRANLRELFTFVAAGIQASVVLSMVPLVLSGAIIEFQIWQVFTNVPLLLRVDGPGLLFACVASVLWIATSLYAIGYMRGLHEHAQTRFYSYFALSLSATMGVAFSANLLTIYFFYEMLSVSTFPLVTHMQDKEARTGGRTYLGYLLFTSLCLLLPALSWCYVWLDGGQVTMDFLADTGKVGSFSQVTQLTLLALFTFGFAKAGLMPLHSWLPGAMVAPTPVSALLHAVAVVKVGVFCVYRVYADIYGTEVLLNLSGEHWLMVLACATILISSLIALSQDNLKRRLAFSTIGQLGYVILGGPGNRSGNGRGGSPHRHACLRENHLVLLCRCHFCGHRKEVCQRAPGFGSEDAFHDGSVHDWIPERDRPASSGWFYQQMVSRAGCFGPRCYLGRGCLID